jgi:hypothetical protein
MAQWWRKGLRAILVVVVVATVGAVAGCGGGDDDEGLPNECIAYCQNSCNKAVACNFFPIGAVNACADACIDALEDEDLTDSDSCLQANSLISALTCDQFADLVDYYSSAADIGKEIGRSCTQ